ncbi:hypothetical protein BACCAP_01097 [Pseudoflavonifractor capillosus ATCC 29799]|uniref:Uncharacterized protein n=1 Tax=Pseudoflavonifractor capillosus ATCC 29799 TaxID=411467 RepID=A6NSB9_9FIRM|nr:hypothetical protein BACCAP_01097 [Pseudoflavonifractor capillosus ATCC 29799]
MSAAVQLQLHLFSSFSVTEYQVFILHATRNISFY